MARLSGRAIDLALAALAAVTVAACALAHASYYLSATLLVAYGLVAAFASFERGRAPVREMALLAALCALAVASRAAFAAVPFFKPVAGVVMLAGIALGARNGFLVGAVAMLASNVLFGQGPWTPWQMLAFGLDGFAFGLLADAGAIPRAAWSAKTRVAVGAAGAAFVLLVTGPLLDTCSVLMFSTGAFTFEGALAVYLAGAVPNALLAAATFLTLLLLGDPFLRAMGRMASKYGVGNGNSG